MAWLYLSQLGFFIGKVIMSEQPRLEQSKVVQLNPERASGQPAPIVLARLPAAMHSLREKARQQLQGLLREYFDKVDDALFELADRANNNQDQNIYFESMREVRLRRRGIENSFFRKIDIAFARLLDHNAYQDDEEGRAKEVSLDDLSIVQNDDLEEMVAVEGMINKANEQYAEPIQHLTLRIDHLVPIKVYQKNNPLGVDLICNAFVDSAKAIHIDVKAKIVLYKLFDNLVMTKLGDLFQALNQHLIDANILPSLKQAPRARRGSDGPQRAQDQYGAGLTAEMQKAEQLAQGQAANAYDEQTNQVLSTLRGLLSQNRTGAPATSFVGGGEVLPTQDLVRMLSLAQHQQPMAPIFAGGAAAMNVRDLLTQLLRVDGEEKHSINQVDDDVINLVSMMFDFILDDRNLAAPMKVLIGRLQIPLLKVAIADKSFFSKGGHPARRLLNEMALAALGWQESTDDSQRKDGLFAKMESIVQTVLTDFETDMGIFNNLLMDFRAFLDKDKRRAQILEQRTLDAEDGKAKSEKARMQVDAVLNRLVLGHDLAAPALKLLREAWGNVLFITALKKGVDSEDWQACIRTAQQLVWSLTAPMTKENRQGLLKLVPELLQKLRGGLEAISYSPFETTQLFKQLEALHLARLRSVPKVAEPKPEAKPDAVKQDNVVALKPVAQAVSTTTNITVNVTPVASTPVADVSKTEVVPSAVAAASSEAPAALHSSTDNVDTSTSDSDSMPEALVVEDTGAVVVEEVAPLVPVDVPLEALEKFVVVPDEILPSTEKVDAMNESDPHYVLVGNITQGSWFEMQSDDGQKYRARLAAIIRATGKYIFVNRSGVKVAEETRLTLASAIKAGRMQVLDDGMLFDRALEAVIGTLRSRP